MSNILVFGASGQLGKCIKQAAKQRRISHIDFFEDKEINILDRKSLEDLFAKKRPNFMINCAENIAIDKAESEPELAKRLNTEGALNAAQICDKYAVTLIHMSTGHVFRGNIPKLLHERDYTEPVNVYGHTKLEGERIISTFLHRHIIIRPGWLYSEYGDNFVKTMLEAAIEQDEINVPVDQIGGPTYAMDLANAILDILPTKNWNYGTYHYSNEGVSSWYDLAKAIVDILKIPVKINPIISNYYATPIKGPAFSAMDKTKIKNTFGLSIPYWRDALKVCLDNLIQNGNRIRFPSESNPY